MEYERMISGWCVLCATGPSMMLMMRRFCIIFALAARIKEKKMGFMALRERLNIHI
jgi:hypothetical protein